MRLGKDVLEADLYAELGLLPDATESEIRASYRHRVRASHPDLNQGDPEAVPRTKRLNVAAKVLLDPTLRRAYDRAPRRAKKPGTPQPRRKAAWFERREQSADDEWVPPSTTPREQRSSFGNFFAELRGRDGRASLQLQELVESLSARQQLGVAALLFAVAVGLFAMSRPTAFVTDVNERATVKLGVHP